MGYGVSPIFFSCHKRRHGRVGVLGSNFLINSLLQPLLKRLLDRGRPECLLLKITIDGRVNTGQVADDPQERFCFLLLVQIAGQGIVVQDIVGPQTDGLFKVG